MLAGAVAQRLKPSQELADIAAVKLRRPKARRWAGQKQAVQGINQLEFFRHSAQRG
jgi:hypothetical protein